MARRRKASSTRRRKSSRQLKAADLVLDPDERCVIKNGVEIHLTHKECALLWILMKNAGHVLTRKRLMKEVWETDYLGDTRTLDVHVCMVRSKIEDNPREPVLIRTMRGQGYMFVVPRRRSRAAK